MIGCGVSKTWYQLAVCRLLEGICESAYVGSAAYLIGAYYTKAEYLTRYTIFFTAGIIAGAFNGFLSSLLSKMDGTAGYKAWRWCVTLQFYPQFIDLYPLTVRDAGSSSSRASSR